MAGEFSFTHFSLSECAPLAWRPRNSRQASRRPGFGPTRGSASARVEWLTGPGPNQGGVGREVLLARERIRRLDLRGHVAAVAVGAQQGEELRVGEAIGQ